jgi:pseudouridine synthase
VDLRAAEIRVDGGVVQKRRHLYIAMHKPAGYVTTRSDEKSRSTVYDLLGERREWVFPVGRLDRDTLGLLVFTNDTEFGQALTSPDAHVPKSYLVRLDRPLAEVDAGEMRSGMTLADGTRLRPASVARAGGEGNVFEVTIDEGKNRQLRRMCEELGYRVLALHRFRIGSLELGALPEGATRPLGKAEVDALRPGRRPRG